MGQGRLVAAAVVGLTAMLASSGGAWAQQYNWSGLYIGLNGGGGWGRNGGTFEGSTFDPGPGGVPNPTHVFVPNQFPGGPEDMSLSGGIVGGQIGYMQQMGGLVFGIEGTWDWSKINGSVVDDATRTPADVLSSSIDDLATINGRIGVANGRWLAYATAGVAFGRVNGEEAGGCGPKSGCVTFDLSGSENHVGWDAGVGISYAATDSVLVGVEYDHVNLGAKDTNLYPDGNPNYETVRFNPELDVIKATVSFKLNTH